MARMAGVLELGFLVAILGMGGCWDEPPVRDAAPSVADDVVGQVGLVRGKVEILSDSDAPRAARPGLELRRSDILRVSPGALAVVSLRNGYLVRVDEGQTLRVAEVAVLDDPPAEESVEAQLHRLATEDELAGSERIAGWQAIMQAGDSVAPVTFEEEPAQPSGEPAAPAATGPAGAGKAEIALAPTPAEARRQVADKAGDVVKREGVLSALGAESGEDGDAIADVLGKQADDVDVARPGLAGVGVGGSGGADGVGGPGGGGPKMAPPARGAPAWRVQSLRRVAPAGKVDQAAARVLKSTVASRAVAGCLADVPPKVARLRLVLTLKEGRVVGIEVAGQPSLPGCLRGAFTRPLPGKATQRYELVLVRR